MGRPDGGWISGYTTPTAEGARGVWSLRDSFAAQRLSQWPSPTTYTELLLHMNGTNGSTTFLDNSARAKTVTAGGSVSISTATSKFGGASASFVASSSFLSIADQDATELLNKSFLIEFFINTTSNTQFATLVSRIPTTFTSGMWTLLMNNASATAGDLALYLGDVNLSVPVVSGGSGLRNGAWHHVAVTRVGSTFSLYIDGSRVATGTSSTTIANINGAIYIGRDQTNGRQFVGNIDEFRLCVGSAMGFSGASIPVPTAEYPNL